MLHNHLPVQVLQFHRLMRRRLPFAMRGHGSKARRTQISYTWCEPQTLSSLCRTPFILIWLYLSAGALHSGSVPLLHRRVPPDRLPPAHPRLQHHAAGQHPPQMTACPAGGGGGRRRPLPALESRRAPRRGDALYCQPLQPRHSNHFWIKTR